MIALQTQMPIAVERLCVLLNAHCVRAMLEMNEDEALTLARMDWGFDVSSGGARSIDLRVLPATVSNYIQTGGARRLDWDWERVSRYLVRGAVRELPGGLRYIEGTTAQLILNCSSTHFMSFVGLQLKKVPGTSHSTGPNGTAKITVDSFLEFLRKRRVR